MIKVIITDDHPIVRQGIRQILEDDPAKRFGEIDEAGCGNELLKKLFLANYDLILLDISLPGRSGLDLLPEIKKISSSAKVLVISICNEEQYAIRALKSGASGYLMKSGAPEELLQAAFKVSQGGRYITTSLAEKLAFNTFEDKEKPLHEALSERELQVVRLLTEGKTTADVARILSLSPKTISTYRERILTKLDLKTTSDIIRYGLKEGIAGELI